MHACLFKRKKNIERQRNWQRSPSHWFIPQVPALARVGSAWSQKPKIQFSSCTWVAGIQPLEPSPATSRVCIRRKPGCRVEPELDPDTLMWNVGILTKFSTTRTQTYSLSSFEELSKSLLILWSCITTYLPRNLFLFIFLEYTEVLESN